jgi:hypothetical protein
LSACTAPGRQRRRPLGVRTAGTSSISASNMVLSLTLAAVTATVSGRPLPSETGGAWSRACHDRRDLRQHDPPTSRAHAHGVDAHPRPLQPAVDTGSVEHLEVELIKHAGLGPFGQPAPHVAGEPQPSSCAGSSRHGVDVRTMYTIAAKQLRSGIVRRRPPYQGRGVNGRSGSTIAHSSSGQDHQPW